MPFASEKQRRYLWVHHPDIARRWSHKYGSKPMGKKRRGRGIHHVKRSHMKDGHGPKNIFMKSDSGVQIPSFRQGKGIKKHLNRRHHKKSGKKGRGFWGSLGSIASTAGNYLYSGASKAASTAASYAEPAVNKAMDYAANAASSGTGKYIEGSLKGIGKTLSNLGSNVKNFKQHGAHLAGATMGYMLGQHLAGNSASGGEGGGSAGHNVHIHNYLNGEDERKKKKIGMGVKRRSFHNLTGIHRHGGRCRMHKMK